MMCPWPAAFACPRGGTRIKLLTWTETLIFPTPVTWLEGEIMEIEGAELVGGVVEGGVVLGGVVVGVVGGADGCGQALKTTRPAITTNAEIVLRMFVMFVFIS